MGYFSSFNDGFNFNQLGSAIGLHGFKPMRQNFENSLGLHGFDKAGKSHGGNALGGLLLAGGAAALGAGGMGGLGGASGATGGASTGGLGGFFQGLLGTSGPGFSGTQAAAPIVDASVPATPQSMSGVSSSFGGGMSMSDLSKYGKPVMQTLEGAQTAQGLLGGNQQIQQPQLNKQNPNFAGLLTQPQNDDERRRQQYQQYVQNIGGRNGLAY